MNDIELKAKRWLEKQGIKVHRQLTPDFISDDGQGFEVKTMRGNDVNIDNLIPLLKNVNNNHILVFKQSGENPVMVLPLYPINVEFEKVVVYFSKFFSKKVRINLGLKLKSEEKSKGVSIDIPLSLFEYELVSNSKYRSIIVDKIQKIIKEETKKEYPYAYLSEDNVINSMSCDKSRDKKKI